ASAAAYAARAGMRAIVLIPEGNIALGKLSQALMHGAQVVAVKGNFDEAERVVEVSDYTGQLGEPPPDRGAEDRRLRDRRRAGRRSRLRVHPCGQRREHHGLL